MDEAKPLEKRCRELFHEVIEAKKIRLSGENPGICKGDEEAREGTITTI